MPKKVKDLEAKKGKAKDLEAKKARIKEQQRIKKKIDSALHKGFKEYLMISLGCLILAVSIKIFFQPFNLVTGGLSGLIIVLLEPLDTQNEFAFEFLYNSLNIILVVIGLFFFGKKFFVKTGFATLLLLIFTVGIQLFVNYGYIPEKISEDGLLAAIYGGILAGIGVGLVLDNGGSTGGIDVPQKILQKVLNVPFSTSLYLIDGLIILSGILVFGINNGMYALIALYITGQLIDKVLVGFRTSTTVNIITKKSQEITDAIYQAIYRGVTLVPIQGGYSKENKFMLIVACHKREYYKLKNVIAEIDSKAFIYVSTAAEIYGEGFNKNENVM